MRQVQWAECKLGEQTLNECLYTGTRCLGKCSLESNELCRHCAARRSPTITTRLFQDSHYESDCGTQLRLIYSLPWPAKQYRAALGPIYAHKWQANKQSTIRLLNKRQSYAMPLPRFSVAICRYAAYW